MTDGEWAKAPGVDSAVEQIVQEVVSEAHLRRDLLLPEEIEYLREHALRKPLRVLHIWSLGVGVVITGEYFGWNLGLPIAGPLGLLIASLIVCVLYLAWVLGLSELSVAMPFAGGPLAYGRRAAGKGFGFLMGWSMFLECLFATIGTGLATGGYVSFLLDPENPDPVVKTGSAIVCALVFFAIQFWGVKEQAVVMLWLTYAAIAALVVFWLASIPGVKMDYILTDPLLPEGWKGVLASVPYALWWLVIIETVALAAEEAHEPHVTIPRGMVLAQITLVVLVVLTWFFASAAAPYLETGKQDYPLPLVLKHVWGSGWFLTTFSAVALAGMVVSYNGMVYATSRQAFSLGRAGYFPAFLGTVHVTRRTPATALAVCTAVTIAFIVFGHFYKDATAVAILISTLTAVIWYVLGMICLFLLRHREPTMFRPYRVPIYPLLPVFIAVLSLFAAYLYLWVNVQVVWPTVGLYAAAIAWYVFWARKTVLPVAPEEVAARIAQELARRQQAGVEGAGANPPQPTATQPRSYGWLGQLTGLAIFVGLWSLAWMVMRALGMFPQYFSVRLEIVLATTVWTALFVLISLVGFLGTRTARENQTRSDEAAGS